MLGVGGEDGEPSGKGFEEDLMVSQFRRPKARSLPLECRALEGGVL